MKIYILHIILLIGFLGIAQNQPKVSAKADTTKIRIGEQIDYQIIVDNAETAVIFPNLQLDSLGKIEIVESLNIDTLKNRLIKKCNSKTTGLYLESTLLYRFYLY